MKIPFNVNGLMVDAEYNKKEVNEIFIPLLKQLALLRTDKDSRVVAYLAAPPGAGKTTLSQLLELLYKEQKLPYSFQSISIDGFHYKRKYLMNNWIEVSGEKKSLNSVKGSPESFDLEALKERIRLLTEGNVTKWPMYDRKLHDVSEETIVVDAEIVLIEGNYLLLDEPGWKELKNIADLTVFIEAKEKSLKSRLIERKMLGGLSLTEAESFYEQSDQRNVIRVLEHSSKADIQLVLTEKRELKKR
ncbi:hypothetical protein SAMN04488569_100872 [Marinilactibacillus piezotolerans]|uniref:Phosphoribulokinase/uridine kinase domain-containing protein n=1 Tax=Marinilactibacillus piezotolerans TaxID=258723 RepID=A0A1I3WL29_9LACT|nr:nucleoside/nucleotide kinase family protein [Marinilactibacillus piezotolerans]SFK07577.1 hypothetical protein SAMN04488569_100872 [Marinilactibacillus piezotolerans]